MSRIKAKIAAKNINMEELSPEEVGCHSSSSAALVQASDQMMHQTDLIGTPPKLHTWLAHHHSCIVNLMASWAQEPVREARRLVCAAQYAKKQREMVSGPIQPGQKFDDPWVLTESAKVGTWRACQHVPGFGL